MSAPETMTLAELEALIAGSKGEWEHTEFKKTTGGLQGGMETLCGFLNGSGGKVLFGVTNAGRIHGQDMADATFQEVANAIRKLEPPAWIEQLRAPVSASKEVLILQMSLHADGPYTFDGRPYVRIGNTTSRMPQADYQRRLLARIGTSHRWENQVAENLEKYPNRRPHRIGKAGATGHAAVPAAGLAGGTGQRVVPPGLYDCGRRCACRHL